MKLRKSRVQSTSRYDIKKEERKYFENKKSRKEKRKKGVLKQSQVTDYD